MSEALAGGSQGGLDDSTIAEVENLSDLKQEKFDISINIRHTIDGEIHNEVNIAVEDNATPDQAIAKFL